MSHNLVQGAGGENSNTLSMMSETSCIESTSSAKEPVSLAVAADVAQIRLEDMRHMSMGKATATRLKSLLSHISTPLASELDESIKRKEYSASNENDDTRDDSNVVKENGTDDVSKNDSASSVERPSALKTPPRPKQLDKGHGFKRFVHHIDNFVHHVSNNRHHHQGQKTTTHNDDVKSAACTKNCDSDSRETDRGGEPANNAAKAHSRVEKQQKSRRHLPLFHSPRSFLKKKFQLSSSNDLLSISQRKQRVRSLKQQYCGVLLWGTTTWDQHEAKVTTALHICELYKQGYDLKDYSQHENEDNIEDDSIHSKSDTDNNIEASLLADTRARRTLSSIGFEFQYEKCNKCTEHRAYESCETCITRLYFTPTQTAVTNENRRKFIADGKMYDAIANLCQAAAQEIMAEQCDLVWVTVCDGKGGGLKAKSITSSDSKSIQDRPRDNVGNVVILDPVRALVSRRKSKSVNEIKSKSNETFLVSTGKGKVSAGIFSRQHLLTTGLEPSTALPLLREARSRGMNCVVIDPNARSDRVGMETFQVSVHSLFQQEHIANLDDAIIPSSSDGNIYVLAHSAAGGQIVRYLLEKNQGVLLSRIRSIAFTDSTHSVQWLKKHPHISSLIQSSKAVYFRSANPMRDDGFENAKPGDECPQDHFWTHRFGKIKTVWAGTTEHSLTNWTARVPIWEHFDKSACDEDEEEVESPLYTDKEHN